MSASVTLSTLALPGPCVPAAPRSATFAGGRNHPAVSARPSVSLGTSSHSKVQATRLVAQADVILEPLPSYKGQVLPGLRDIKFQLEQNFAADPVVVGAVPGMSDVVIDIPTVSGKHAQFELVDGSLVCRDLKSTNGTRVNGKKLPRGGEVELQQGDVVSFAKDCPFQVNYDMQ